MRLVVQCKITRISCALYFILFQFRLLNVGCIFSRIPFAVLTLLSHLRRRVVRTSACPSNPHNSISLVFAFPPHPHTFFFHCKAGFFFFTIHPLSSWFSVISGSCTRLFVRTPLPTCYYFQHSPCISPRTHCPATPCTHICTRNCGCTYLSDHVFPPLPVCRPRFTCPLVFKLLTLFPTTKLRHACGPCELGRTLPLLRENGRALGFFTPRTLFHTSLQSSFPFFCSCQNLVDHICRLGYHMTRQILL